MYIAVIFFIPFPHFCKAGLVFSLRFGGVENIASFVSSKACLVFNFYVNDLCSGCFCIVSIDDPMLNVKAALRWLEVESRGCEVAQTNRAWNFLRSCEFVVSTIVIFSGSAKPTFANTKRVTTSTFGNISIAFRLKVMVKIKHWGLFYFVR